MTAPTRSAPGPAPASAQDSEAIFAALAARFQSGVQIYVNDTWLVHLAALDRALAVIEPNYTLAEVKEKFGTLRYYFDQPDLDCCVSKEAHDPLPDDEGPLWDAWCDREDAHLESDEHQQQAAAKEVRQGQMNALVNVAENASGSW